MQDVGRNFDGEDALGILAKGELERQLWPINQWPDLELAEVLWRCFLICSTHLCLFAIGATIRAVDVREGLDGIDGNLSFK